jgi:hypothetical protein
MKSKFLKNAKPCPFCGAPVCDDLLGDFKGNKYGLPVNIFASCSSCTAIAASAPTRKKAVENWNRRA